LTTEIAFVQYQTRVQTRCAISGNADLFGQMIGALEWRAQHYMMHCVGSEFPLYFKEK